MSFHTFTLPEDRCARLLVKNLGRGMPESLVREELETLGIHVQGVTQLRSGRRNQDPNMDRLSTPHFIVSVAREPEVSRVRSITELCGLRVSGQECRIGIQHGRQQPAQRGSMSVGISVTTWGARHHGNTAVADDSCAGTPPLLTAHQARHHGNTSPPPLLSQFLNNPPLLTPY